MTLRPNRCLRSVLALGVFALATIARSQTPDTPALPPAPGELRQFDQFLNSHSVIDDQLRQDPGLADKPEFLQNHPDYAAYVADHPGLSKQLKAHPRYLVRRALNRQHNQPITAAEQRHIDRFLALHPKIAQELEKHPGLADDPRFVEDHAELHNFMNRHPGADEGLESKPKQAIDQAKKQEEKAK